MSQIDDYMRRSGGSGRRSPSSAGSSREPDERRTSESWFLSYVDGFLSSDVDITNRDDIINPEDILSNFWNIFPDTVENRAKYEQLLNALRNVQAQQEASYQEWYNSTAQQALRDQQAGLNTDILGISGASQASAAEVGSSQPMSGLPTSEEMSMQQEQIRLSRFQSVMSAVSSICSIPASFAGAFGSVASGIGSLKMAKAASQLSNLQATEQFENLAGSEIASRLSDSISSSLSAGQSLDLASWFSDENNFAGILDAYSPPGSDFSASFANVRKRMQRTLGSAYADGKVTAENQGSFSALLADPRYSSDQIVQIAHLKPYMQARADLQLLMDKYQSKVAEVKTKFADGMNVDSAIDAANAKFEFDGKYYDSRDGANEALAEWYVKESEGIIAKMRGAIEQNLLDVYNANPNNERGFAAAYLSGARSMDWYEYLIAQELALGLNRVSAPVPSQSKPNLVDPSSAASSGSDLWQNSIIRSAELLP